MTLGIDTSFLVHLEIRESAGHEVSRAFLNDRVLNAGHVLALAPQVLAEFIHVATDPRRFEEPLTMSLAIEKADYWWRAAEVRPVVPESAAVTLFTHWMTRYALGRKRILDTMLAATYVAAGIRRIVSTDARDYRIFEELEVWNPLGRPLT